MIGLTLVRIREGFGLAIGIGSVDVQLRIWQLLADQRPHFVVCPLPTKSKLVSMVSLTEANSPLRESYMNGIYIRGMSEVAQHDKVRPLTVIVESYFKINKLDL